MEPVFPPDICGSWEGTVWATLGICSPRGSHAIANSVPSPLVASPCWSLETFQRLISRRSSGEDIWKCTHPLLESPVLEIGSPWRLFSWCNFESQPGERRALDLQDNDNWIAVKVTTNPELADKIQGQLTWRIYFLGVKSLLAIRWGGIYGCFVIIQVVKREKTVCTTLNISKFVLFEPFGEKYSLFTWTISSLECSSSKFPDVNGWLFLRILVVGHEQYIHKKKIIKV